MLPSAAAHDAIRAAVVADLAPARLRSLRERGLMVGAAAVLAAAAAAPAPRMPGIQPAYGRGAAVGAVAVVAATLGIVIAFASYRGRRLRAFDRLVATIAIACGWLVYLAAVASSATAQGAVEIAAIGCCVRALIAGSLLAFAAFRVFRHADPWTPRRTGMLVGAAAGCVTAAGVGIGCGSEDLGHLLVGHALVLPLLAALGALSGRRWLRP
jgi:hypothetical protein